MEEFSILGEWKSAYQIMEDGSFRYENPYALTEFEYSDGFILEEDGKGSTIWFGNVNGSFKWEEIGTTLRMRVPGPGEELANFDFEINELSQDSMLFNTPKGYSYRLAKVQ